MGIQKGPIFITGMTKDGVIFYESAGQYLTRTAPGKGGVKQTEATKKSATTFGEASRCATLVYNAFRRLIPDYCYKKPMFDRVRSRMIKVIGQTPVESVNDLSKEWNFKELDAFQFNENGILPNILRNQSLCRVDQDNMIVVEIPELNPQDAFIVPKKTTEVRVRVMAAEIDFFNKCWVTGEVHEIRYPFEDIIMPAVAVRMNAGGKVVLAGLQVSFFNRDKQLSSIELKEYEASALVGVFTV